MRNRIAFERVNVTIPVLDVAVLVYTFIADRDSPASDKWGRIGGIQRTEINIVNGCIRGEKGCIEVEGFPCIGHCPPLNIVYEVGREFRVVANLKYIVGRIGPGRKN